MPAALLRMWHLVGAGAHHTEVHQADDRDGSVSLSPHGTSALAQPCPHAPGRSGKRPQGTWEPVGRRELENVPRVWQQQQQAGRAAGSHAQLPGRAQLHGVRLCHTVSQDAQPG